MPVAQHRLKGCDASGRADLDDQRGDLLQPVAASSELVDEQGVAHVGGVVDPVARLPVAAWLDQAGAFPLAQGGRADAEPSCQGADERFAAFLRHGIEVAKRGFDGLEGAAVVEKLGVTLVDEPERVLVVPRLIACMINVAVWWPCPGTRARNARRACACSGV